MRNKVAYTTDLSNLQEKVKLENERDDCPACNCSEHKIIYKGKNKPFKRCFIKVRCLCCGHEYILENNEEFNDRILTNKIDNR